MTFNRGRTPFVETAEFRGRAASVLELTLSVASRGPRTAAARRRLEAVLERGDSLAARKAREDLRWLERVVRWERLGAFEEEG